MIGRLITPVVLVTAAVMVATWAAPPPAAALNVGKPVCTVAGLFSGLLGKVCTAATHGKQLLSAGNKLLGGHPGGAAKALLGGGAATKALSITASLAAVGAWVFGGAKFALHETAAMVSATTAPQLTSSWFSGFYWRMAAVSALLTLPFLFAAAVQALVRSDLTLLLRSAFGYLPLGLLAVAIAAPLTTLLLAGSDELSHIVSGAAGHAENDLLLKAAGGGALVLASKSAFFAFFVGLFTAAAALVLWCELMIRSAAVYVIVLMLPLFFAALVWPARRVWAVRAVEVLVALILSKFAIVAVLALGGAAIGHTLFPGFAAMLAGATLILLAAFSPWALLRMLPLHELAAGAAGGLRSQGSQLPGGAIGGAADLAQMHADRMLARREAAEDGPAQTTVGRLDPPQGREPSWSEATGEADAEIADADTGPLKDSGEAPPVAVLQGQSDGVAAGNGRAGPSAAAGVASPAAAAPSGDGTPADGGAGASASDVGDEASAPAAEAPAPERLSEEVGLIVRPGQTLHFSPQPEWSSDGVARDAGDAGPEAESKAAPAGEALPDEHDPLPPRQPPQDGQL